MAGDLLMSVSQSEKERAIFRSRRMFQSDNDSNLATAEARGRMAGRQEGRRAEKFEVARNLMGFNVPVDTIIKSTGLTREDIESLRQ